MAVFNSYNDDIAQPAAGANVSLRWQLRGSRRESAGLSTFVSLTFYEKRDYSGIYGGQHFAGGLW